jgi:hypothetical protein
MTVHELRRFFGACRAIGPRGSCDDVGLATSAGAGHADLVFDVRCLPIRISSRVSGRTGAIARWSPSWAQASTVEFMDRLSEYVRCVIRSMSLGKSYRPWPSGAREAGADREGCRTPEAHLATWRFASREHRDIGKS